MSGAVPERSQVQAPGAVPRRRFWSAIQIVAVLFAIEGALWTQGRSQKHWFIVAVVIIVVTALFSHPTVRDLGLGVQGMLRTAWVIPLAALVCGSFIAASIWLHTFTPLYGNVPVTWHAIFYAIWALEQQFILNAIFYKRFEHLLGNTTTAVLSTAALFSLVHIPNPVLVPATFLGGLLFVEAFRRWRNIYPLAIAHAIFGLTLAVTMPDNWIRHMRVGLSFLRFHARG